MKCRIFRIHPDTNPSKLNRLEALHAGYVAYVCICVQTMLTGRTYNLPKSAKQAFFPKAEKLTSQIEKNARDHAIAIVSTWAAGVYSRKMMHAITRLRKDATIGEDDAKALYTIGKKQISKPWKFITQGHLDAYHALLDEVGGNPPEVRDSIPMKLSEMTARLENPDKAVLGGFWLRVSSLDARKSLWLPLVGNPYVQHADQVSRGIQARKTKRGFWRFETASKASEQSVPVPEDHWPRLGVDVGLNVLAATSDGQTFGEHVKPAFDKMYARIKSLRANRQRQGLKDNSPKLDRLESRLSGMVKTETGRVVNTMIARHPDTVFVVEDLDLRGCRGQKRFAYRALQTNLERKAPTEKVNPAYTSQECPSCGYIHRGNRSGIKFKCRGCGRKAHADWVGSFGVLRRSEDQHIGTDDHPRLVKQVLRERYRSRRNPTVMDSFSEPAVFPLETSSSPLPLGRRLTTVGLGSPSSGTASELMPASFSRF